ncbi:MAG: hypothetical protein Q7J32_11370 [Sphingomonadaceae bacterium]|nr:hypothetical protein [Sphingomonadaceae bacterium]
MTRRLLLLTLTAALAVPAAADPPRVRKVPLQSTAVEPQAPKGLAALFTKKSRRACIGSERIAAAVVTGERSIDLVLTGGERWRMGFKADCPALSYYQGFYYRQTQAGRLCAGRDAVLTRSGAECPIESLAKIKTAKKRQ